MFYDHFTPFCLINLETYGFVPPGEAKDFVEGGHNIRFDGQLPTNTHGGNHSEAYIHGLTHVQEVCPAHPRHVHFPAAAQAHQPRTDL